MRLTSKLEDNWYCVDFVKSEEETYRNAINKLGRLEDIEEELGIDSIIFLRMFTQENIYIKCNNEIFENDVELAINCDDKGYFINLEVCHFDRLYLKDYGKTWALTKEELE